MRHTGGCHCGNIQVVFESSLDPGQTDVRACQCSFCRKHNTRAVSDPDGMLTISVAARARLNRYTFAHRTAEYLLCRECGVYVAAVTVDGDERRAILIVNSLDDHQLFGREPIAMDYSSESRAERAERRRKVWMPVSIEYP